MSSPNPTTGSKTGRARRRFAQLWQAPTFVLGVLAFIGVAASAPWRHSPHTLQLDAQLSVLRKGLDNDADPDALVRYAEAALLNLPMSRWRVAEVHFLAGSAYYRQARQKPDAVAKEIWPRAVEHLDKAMSLTPPEADRPALQYRLGYSLYKQGQNWPRAIELMTLTIEKGAENPLEGYVALADANQKLARPNLDAAIFALRRVIELTQDREADKMAEALLTYADLLMRNDKRPEAIKAIERISLRAKRDLRIKGKLMHANACMEQEGLAHAAVPIWQELLPDAAHVEGGRAYIYYQLGWSLFKTKTSNPEDIKKAWSNALIAGGPAGQAAGLRLGQFKITSDVRLADQAIHDWRKALEKVTKPEDFKNPYIDAADVVDLLDEGMKIVEPDAEKAQAVAELYRRVAKGSTADARVGQVTETRADELFAKWEGKTAGVTIEQVQAQYRRAAEAYQKAAGVCSTSERTDLQWRSIKCYRKAKDDATAKKLLTDEYLKVEVREANLAEGWFTLGDICLGESKEAEAHAALVKCLQYPDTLFAYRANYLLAVMEIERKNYDQARAILKRILEGNPDIDRAAHEKASYKMGPVLMLMGEHGKAVAELKTAVALYPENPLAFPTRLQLGECYCVLAGKEAALERAARDRLPTTPDDLKPAIEENLRNHGKARKECVHEAVKTYMALRDQLEAIGRAQPLEKSHQGWLRRARFAIGDCHVGGEEYESAIAAYRDVQLKHPKTVEGMYACLRICWAVQFMRPPTPTVAVKYKEQAMESIRMLQEDLKELPENHEVFRAPNTLSRADWVREAGDAQKRLLEPPKKQPLKAFP